ncbi:MAG: hypothetical protein U5K69_24470 [Balneolaceae bacterium]|nr:hypothetical protein [Balneolaceae bacterium]
MENQGNGIGIENSSNVKSTRIAVALLLLMGVLLVSGCAETITLTEPIEREQVGFWYGLWHGFILPFSFIVSLFDSDVAIYAIYNTGAWYDFGFLLGASCSIGGSSKAT